MSPGEAVIVSAGRKLTSKASVAPPGVSTKALNAVLAAIQANATVHDNIGAFQLAIRS